MDRKEAEKVVRRDLPTVIKEMLHGIPGRPPDGLANQIYDTIFEPMISNLMDGTVPLGPDGRLTAQLVDSTGTLSFKLRDSSGDITSLPNT